MGSMVSALFGFVERALAAGERFFGSGGTSISLSVPVVDWAS